jgi:hypothetical protein
LVDSDAEHRVLETLLENTKPEIQRNTLPQPNRQASALHYLLFTPFRYPPLRHGSRFGSALVQGIWYGSEHIRTALCEVAYYRLVFLEGTQADLGAIEVELSSFRVKVASVRAIDLCAPPYSGYAAEIASKVSYDTTQQLGTMLREHHIEIVRYPSARDALFGTNLALFSPLAFREKKPHDFLNWRCFCTKTKVEFTERTFFERRRFEFPREDFLVNGRLPTPAL